MNTQHIGIVHTSKMPRPVDNNNVRDLEEIDLLYHALQNSESEIERLHKHNRKLTNENARLQRSYLLLLNHGDSQSNEAVGDLQEANRSLVDQVQALSAEIKVLLQENDVYLSKIKGLTKENLDLKVKASGEHQIEERCVQQEISRLQEEIRMMESRVQEAQYEKDQALMLVEMKDSDLRKRQNKIDRLSRENQFLKSSQNDSSGAASPDVLPAAEGCDECSGFSFVPDDSMLRRSKRFSSTRLPQCQKCKKHIKPGQYEECYYHDKKPVGIRGWRKIAKYAEYASDVSYIDHKYWPCCDVFCRTAVRGCMTGQQHVVNAVK